MAFLCYFAAEINYNNKFRFKYAIFLFSTFYIFLNSHCMKRFLLFLLLMLCFGAVFGTDYSRIDKQSETVPVKLNTAPEIATYLTRNLTAPTEKVRAIYSWIAHNIRYDVVKMKLNETYVIPQELVDYALSKREGVCANYTALFNACCLSVGIQCYIIEGYVRQNGKLIFNSHSWNAVRIDNRFYEVDVTWAAGYVDNDKFTAKYKDEFFMVSPSVFIKTHMPNDPIWQFSSNPLTFIEFDTANFQKLTVKSTYNFSDSIRMFSKQNILEQLQRKRRRIIQCGMTNSFIKSVLTDLYNESTNEDLRIQTEKYNRAVTEMNKGVIEYNKYVAYLQNSAIKSKEDTRKLVDLLKLAREKTHESSRILSSVKTDNLTLSTDIKRFRKEIESKFSAIDAEISFVSNYKTSF
jgi:hypothetical protein